VEVLLEPQVEGVGQGQGVEELGEVELVDYPPSSSHHRKEVESLEHLPSLTFRGLVCFAYNPHCNIIKTLHLAKNIYLSGRNIEIKCVAVTMV